MRRLLGLWSLWFAVCVGLCGVGLPTRTWAGPPPFDPKNMSGIPRADPQVPSGTVTVRVLGEGGFSDPKVGVDVTLELRGRDGNTKTVVEKTVEEGRATFSGLAEFAGGKAVAKVELGGRTVQSLPIDILPSTGSRVMLVQGAAEAGTGSGAGPHAGQRPPPGVPMPGSAFPLDGQPAGSLTVGTFDLAAKKPISGVDITLTIEVPEGPPIVRAEKTDASGKVVFSELLPPAIPEGAKLVVEGTLIPGGELRRSEPFTMDETKGMAVVLAEGAASFDPAAETADGPGQRPPVPAPRVLRTLTPGQVRVKIVDADERPVANQPLTLVKKAAGGGVTELEATTDANGIATIDNVGVQQDALHFVQTVYDNGPYQSRFFGMDRRGGVAVDLRVFPTTSDASVVRSAVQYDVDELENDLGQVVQIYEVMVQGDKAYWDPRGLKIEGMPGAKGFTVLRPAEPFLDHDESAPFATLHGPIPPGELVNLSVGYLLDHEGSVRIEWTPPFEVVESSILVTEDFVLEAEGAEESEAPTPIPDKKVYKLGPRAFDPATGAAKPVKFEMTGLEVRNPVFRRVALYGSVVMACIVVIGFAMHQRGTPRDRLLARRDELLALLERSRSGTSDGKAVSEEQVLSALDRIYRQLAALDEIQKGSGARPATDAKPEA